MASKSEAKTKAKNTKSESKTKNNELDISERIGEFIQKNRMGILIGLIAVIAVLAGFIVTNAVRGKILSNALSKVDGFNRRYEELKLFIGNDDPETLLKQAEVFVLIEELSAFEDKNSGLAAARAYDLSGNIYADQKNWAQAEEAWSLAAKAAAKSYLVPVYLYNAAVAAEEQGNTDSAIALYTRTLGYGNSFPSAARAQFSIGRLEESRNNIDAALEAYRSLLSKWPDDPVWLNLAQSRILVISE